VPGTQC